MPWVDFGRAPFEMTDQLQNPPKLNVTRSLRIRTGCAPALRSTSEQPLERAARHRDVRDVASRNYLGVVQQAVGELEFGSCRNQWIQQEKRISNACP